MTYSYEFDCAKQAFAETARQEEIKSRLVDTRKEIWWAIGLRTKDFSYTEFSLPVGLGCLMAAINI
jgi:hypothetical protein